MMEDATITEAPRLAATTRQALEEDLADALLQRSRGAFWLGEIDDDGYTVDVHHAYYVREPNRTRCVHDYYARLLRMPIEQTEHGFETRLPGLLQVSARFEQAKEFDEKAIKEAVTAAFSPIVAEVGRTAGHMAKFEGMYVNYFQRNERLFPQRGLNPEYILYLEALHLIEGNPEKGYVLTHDATTYIKEFRQRFPQLEANQVGTASSVPFLALCMKDWEFLSSELGLTTITSYFRLLTSVFDHHYRARAKPKQPEHHPITLEGIIGQMRRYGWGRQTKEKLRPRLRHLAEAGALVLSDDDVVHMRPEWYEVGVKEATRRIGDARQALQLAA